MERMRLPSHRYINRQLYDMYAIPPTIKRHCEKVRDVAMVLAEGLKKDGVDINLKLVDRLSLVHDSMKAVTLPTLTALPEFGYVPTARELEVQAQMKERYPNMHETLIASDVLRGDFPRFAEYVANIGSTGNPTYLNAGIELQVAHYADWRVQQDQIIPFGDRLEYLRRTYLTRQPEKGDAWWEQAVRAERELEQEIFSHLSFSPDQLADVVAAKSKRRGVLSLFGRRGGKRN